MSTPTTSPKREVSVWGRIGIAGILFGLILTGLAGYFHYNLARFKKDGVQTRAQIYGSSTRTGKFGNKTVTLHIKFETKTGQLINTDIKSPEDINLFGTEILYLPYDPEEALHIKYLESEYQGFWENLPLGILILVLGLGAGAFELYQEKQWKKTNSVQA